MLYSKSKLTIFSINIDSLTTVVWMMTAFLSPLIAARMKLSFSTPIEFSLTCIYLFSFALNIYLMRRTLREQTKENPEKVKSEVNELAAELYKDPKGVILRFVGATIVYIMCFALFFYGSYCLSELLVSFET